MVPGARPKRWPTKRGAKTGKRALKMRARRLEALNLRTRGLSYEEIAEAMSCSRTAAHRYVTKAVDALETPVAERVLRLELRRLDRLYRAAEAGVDGSETERDGVLMREGAPQFISAALGVMARRAKLLGLDAPQKVETTTSPVSLEALDLTGLGPEDARALLGLLARTVKGEEQRASLLEQLAMLEGARA
jgi:hypothetical protein